MILEIVGAPVRYASIDLASTVSDMSTKADFHNYLQPEESDLGFQVSESTRRQSTSEEEVKIISDPTDEERDLQTPASMRESQPRKRSIDGTTLLLQEVQTMRAELTGQSQRTTSSQRLILEKLEDLGDDLQGYGMSSPSFLSPSSTLRNDYSNRITVCLEHTSPRSREQTPYRFPSSSMHSEEDSGLISPEAQIRNLQNKLLELTTHLAHEKAEREVLRHRLEEVERRGDESIEMSQRKDEELVRLQEALDEALLKDKLEFQHIYNKVINPSSMDRIHVTA